MRPSHRKMRRASRPQQEESDYSHTVYLSPRKRTRRIQALPQIYAPQGRRYIQQRNLPIPPGQLGLLERVPETATQHVSTLKSPEKANTNDGNAVAVSLHQRKRIAQNNRWNVEVIPRIVRPYLHLVHATNNLKDKPPPQQKECTCLQSSKNLSLIVLRLYSKL